MKKLLASLSLLAFLSCAVTSAVAQVNTPSGGGVNQPIGPPVPSGVVQNNPNSSSAPTSNNDSTQGYSVGSTWQQSTTGRTWIARSVAVGAAVWTLTDFYDHLGYIAANWYIPLGTYGSTSGANPGANTIRIYPAFIRERITINALGMQINTLSAGGNVQAAIYANNASTNQPTGTALASTASMSTASTGPVNAAVSLQVEPGLYWFASNCDNATAIFAAVLTSGNASALVGNATQSNVLTAGAGIQGYSFAQTFNTWPDLTAASLTAVVSGSGVTPIVEFKVASVP